MWSLCDSTIMDGECETPMNDKTPISFNWADAAILSAASFGILLGVSILSFEVAAALGVVTLIYVIIKLVTT